jgi:hypothetical protein
MAHKIAQSDITDKMAHDLTVRDTNVEKWLDEVDAEFDVVCQQEDVEDYSATSTELRTTLHTIVKRYLISYMCKIVFRDKIGAGGPTNPMDDIYSFKHKQSSEECDKLRAAISYNLLCNEDTEIEPEDTIGSGVIYRG